MPNLNEFTSREGIRYTAEPQAAGGIACCYCDMQTRNRCAIPREDPNEPDCRPQRRADNRQIVWKKVARPDPADPNPL